MAAVLSFACAKVRLLMINSKYFSQKSVNGVLFRTRNGVLIALLHQFYVSLHVISRCSKLIAYMNLIKSYAFK